MKREKIHIGEDIGAAVMRVSRSVNVCVVSVSQKHQQTVMF